MRVKVTEYWPNFVERSDDRRSTICNDSEVLSVPWLREPETLTFDRGSLDQNYIPQGYLMREGWIIALVHPAEQEPQ